MTQTVTMTYTTVTPQEFAKSINSPEIFLIDVRTPEEYATGHIKNAKNIDVEAPDFMTQAEAILPAGKTIAVYCGSGKRSAIASQELADAGYPILNLAGGLAAWKEAGLPVV